jgi:FkbM family methyltransferase
MLRHVPTYPLKRWVWSMVRRREFDFETTTARGWIVQGNTTDWIQRQIYYFGLWEPNLSAWIESRLALGDVFVDVGANVGYFTLLAAHAVGATGKVVSVEPMPEIFQRLADHVTCNKLTNVRLVNEAAVGPGEEGTVSLYWGGEKNTGCTSMLPPNPPVRSATAVARTLASILTDEESRRARVIKIDVEGVEAAAIRGLGLESGRFSNNLELVVEILHDKSDPERSAQLLHYMEDLGFHAYVMPDDHPFREYAFKNAKRRSPWRLFSTSWELTQSHNIIFSRADMKDQS